MDQAYLQNLLNFDIAASVNFLLVVKNNNFIYRQYFMYNKVRVQ